MSTICKQCGTYTDDGDYCSNVCRLNHALFQEQAVSKYLEKERDDFKAQLLIANARLNKYDIESGDPRFKDNYLSPKEGEVLRTFRQTLKRLTLSDTALDELKASFEAISRGEDTEGNQLRRSRDALLAQRDALLRLLKFASDFIQPAMVPPPDSHAGKMLRDIDKALRGEL